MQDKEIDITLPVLIDNVVQEFKATSELVKRKTNVSDYIIECALERLLLELKNNKALLYGTTLYQIKATQKNSIDIKGTEEELRKFADDNNIPIIENQK